MLCDKRQGAGAGRGPTLKPRGRMGAPHNPPWHNLSGHHAPPAPAHLLLRVQQVEPERGSSGRRRRSVAAKRQHTLRAPFHPPKRFSYRPRPRCEAFISARAGSPAAALPWSPAAPAAAPLELPPGPLRPAAVPLPRRGRASRQGAACGQSNSMHSVAWPGTWAVGRRCQVPLVLPPWSHLSCSTCGRPLPHGRPRRQGAACRMPCTALPAAARYHPARRGE